jgi:glycosyltransferase involved in cell wall biosynthesis
VGDYSRRLAAECIRQGHPSILVSLNDAYVSEIFDGTQQMEGASACVLRLPAQMHLRTRMVEARNWLNIFNPDWLSLQFVPFGFHPKGLCFGLGSQLAMIAPQKKWHVMFHELWVGLGENATIKHRVWGALQRLIILDMLRHLRPKKIHTQADPYQKVLSQEKVESVILPLFGNVTYVKDNGWGKIIEALLAKVMDQPGDRQEFFLAGIFGAVHPEWNVEQALESLLPLTTRFQKRLVLVFLGRNNLTVEEFDSIRTRLKNRADVVVTGERSNLEISKILQALDLGLATSPRQNIQKSGTVAAMLEHGLSVLVTRDDWRLRGATITPTENAALFSPAQLSLLEALPVRNPRPSHCGVQQVAEQMLAELKPSLLVSSAKSPDVIGVASQVY